MGSGEKGRGKVATSVAMLMVGLLMGSVMLTPVGAHIKNFNHLKTKHFFTKKAADARFINVGETASNADKIDNIDSAAFVQKATVVTGHFSCAGTAFSTATNTKAYDSASSLRHPTGDAANPRFRCNLVVPHGATLTGVTFSVLDTSATEQVERCEMWRTNLLATIGTETQMADAGATGIAPVPGAVTLTDTTIDVPAIDNSQYAYFIQCHLTGTTVNTGLYGATVRYTSTAGTGTATTTTAKRLQRADSEAGS